MSSAQFTAMAAPSVRRNVIDLVFHAATGKNLTTMNYISQVIKKQFFQVRTVFHFLALMVHHEIYELSRNILVQQVMEEKCRKDRGFEKVWTLNGLRMFSQP